MSQWQERLRGLVSWRIWLTLARLAVLLGAGLLAMSPFDRADATEEGTETAPESVSRAGDRFRDCAGCPEMVVVSAGSYLMGSRLREEGRWEREGPRHRVTIAAPFALGRYEVTVAEFERFVEETGYLAGNSCSTLEDHVGEGSWRNTGFHQNQRHPVACVSWNDAQAYVAWLARETGQEYRLPSEAEWEYAARAGTSTAHPWEGTEDEQCRHANGHDASLLKHVILDEELGAARFCDDGHVHTALVGSFAANGWGLQDMLGNVSEWTEDCWNDSYAGAPSDGSAWELRPAHFAWRFVARLFV